MYEYRCPSCKGVETRSQSMARLVCSKCGHEWLTGEGNTTTIIVSPTYVPTYPQPYIPWPTYPMWPNPVNPGITWEVTCLGEGEVT